MIPVARAEEPETFDARVRQPGRIALAKSVVTGRDADLRPLWQRAIPDLMAAYDQVCAYSCFRIHPTTGAGSVDHYIPKSASKALAYEWCNYRLACARMNARKHEATDVLDPFEVQHGWFALELVGFQVVVGAGIATDVAAQVTRSIERLHLNADVCCETREEYATSYWSEAIDWNYLQRNAPFVALELERQERWSGPGSSSVVDKEIT